MASFMTRFRAHAAVPLVYLVLSIAFFLPAIATGRVPLPLENAYTYADPYWKQYQPEALSSAANFTLVDLTNYYHPYMVYAVGRLSGGQSPLWNPEIYSGMPFLAAQQPAVLYPTNLLFVPLGPFWIWVGSAILRLFLSGWGLHLLVRRFGLGTIAAFWSGVTYQFCGSNVAWLHFVVHNVVAWLPLALYSTDRLIEAPRGRWFLLLVACLAFQFLGGHPETSVLFALVWGSFVLARVSWRSPLRSVAWLGAAVVAAIGVTLPQLLPTLDLIPESGTFFKRMSQGAEEVPGREGLWSNLRHWLLIANPYTYGTPLGNRYLTRFSNYNEMITYMGVLTVPLMAAGIAAGRPRRIVAYWSAVALLSLALIYPLPGFSLLLRLPVLNLGHGIRYILSWSIAASVLAGFGVEAVLRGSGRARAVLLAVGTLALLLLGWSIYDLATTVDGSWILRGIPGWDLLRRIASFYNRESGQLLGLIAAAAGGWMLLLALVVARRRTVIATLLLVVTTGEMLVHGVPYNGFARPEASYPRTPMTEALQARGGYFRIATLDGIMLGNTSMTQGLQNAFGEDDLAPFRYQVFAGRRSKIGLDEGTYVIQPLAQRFFDLANVHYLLTTKPVSGTTEAGAWRLIRQDGEVRAYENPAMLPRAYVVPAVRQVAPDVAVEAAYELNWDPRREAIVEEAVEGLDQAAGTPLEATAEIESYEPEQVAVDVAASRAAFLVLSDSYATGWTAEIDGQPARLYRTNGVYRGVVVPAGAHGVVFTYRPAAWEIGRIVALGTIVACLGGTYAARRRRETHDEKVPASSA